MTDNFAHLDVDDDEFSEAPRGLRDAYKRLQKSYNEQLQQITELRDQTAASALSGVLAGFKNPERVKSAILGDKVDPLDNEAVTKWLEANGDDYARAQAPADPQETEPQEQAQVPDYGRLNAPANVGQPSGVDPAQIVNSAPTDLSPEKLRQWFVDRGI